ncbi:glutathione S-transferase family protein [Leptospira sp. 'Mane']|uniref:glutathione S-transferase family protein n=1 Tax=Leptospira sp. 'Mane' TaxID=3387407 RepID=UPI00398A7B9E
MEKPTLISFKLCPFVQRSVITLLEKKADYEIKYIDLANKPDWFLKISPMGKVPVLQVGEHVLFESAVINEYLDEVNPPSLHPTVPIEKAKQRAWIEFASAILMDQYMLTMTKDKVEFDKKISDLNAKFSQLESILPDGFSDSLYFGGKTFQLIDTSFAPAFMRFDFLEKSKANLKFFENFPKVSLWSKTLLSKDSVKNSVLPEVHEGYIRFIKDHNSYLGSLI